jgi:hypothetical protein
MIKVIGKNRKRQEAETAEDKKGKLMLEKASQQEFEELKYDKFFPPQSSK